MRRHRIISLSAVLVLLISLSLVFVARNAFQFETRGIPDGFSQPINNAESLLVGVNVQLEQYDDVTLDARLTDLVNHHVHYLRQEFRWTDIEPVHGQMNWAASDRIIGAIRRHDMQLLPVLTTTPEWARIPSGSTLKAPSSETTPPSAAGDFAWFAHQFALRFDTPYPNGQPLILAYQIWDEPNLSANWGNGLISPAGYLKVLWAARNAIQMVTPSARIVLAGLAPTVEQSDVNLAPEVFLTRLYQLGGHDAFDIVALKPYGFDYSPYDRRVDPGLLTLSRAILAREVMIAHGEGNKAIWFTQWGWNAQLPNWRGSASIWGNVNEQQQAIYTEQFVQRVALEWPWVGGMFVRSLQPYASPTDPQWGFSLLDQSGLSRPVYTALSNTIPIVSISPRAAWASAGYGLSKYLGLGKTPVYGPNPMATYSSDWRFSELGADIPQTLGAGMSFHFGGNALALIVRRGNYRAYLYITIDGEPGNLLPRDSNGSYLILTSPDEVPRIETIQVADMLGPGKHTAEITIDRGWNQWSLLGWSSKQAASPDINAARSAQPFLVVIALFSILIATYSLPRSQWNDLLRRLRPRAQEITWQTFATAILVWVSTSLTWAQDTSTAYQNLGAPLNLVLSGVVSGVAFWSPIFVVSLISLVVLFVLVMLRLDLGLVLVAFFIPFYLVPQRLFAKSFPMVELLTLMCSVSWGLRRLNALRMLRRTFLISRDGGHLSRVFGLLIRRVSLLDWGILALVFVAALSTTQADFKVEALRELRLVILEPAVIFLILCHPVQRLETRTFYVWRIVDGFVAGAILIALIGLVNYAQGNVFPAEFGLPRIRSVYGSSNNDALFLSRAFPILFAVVFFGRWPIKTYKQTVGVFGRVLSRRMVQLLIGRRMVYSMGLVFVTIAIILSQSRASLLFGLPSAIIVMCILAGGKWRWLGIGLGAVMGLILAVLLSGIAAPLVAGTRFQNVLDLTQGTGFFRVNLWQSAVVMWRDHFWLGVGPDNFLYAYRGFYIRPAAWQEPNLSHPHNIILDFATRLGVLGLVSGILIGIGVVRALRKAWINSQDLTHKPLVIGLAGLFTTILVHGMLDHSIFLVDLSFVFMVAAGIVSQLAKPTSTLEMETHQANGKYKG